MLDYINTGLLLVAVALIGKNKITITRSGGSPWLVDSCTLIDGRIKELLQANVNNGTVYIPNTVIEELQYLADGQDAYKRSRARFGLDIAAELRDMKHVKVQILSGERLKGETVDDFLIRTAKRHHAKLVTLDYNLLKVATVKKVQTININDLTQRLKPVILPGERVKIKIVQKGSERQQGVGYLDDGTMVVVESTANKIGKTLEVEVQRYLQTDSGKMIFASQLKPPKQK
jgi:uncharacterized protein YacL